MKIGHILATTAAVLAIGLVSPAMAQQDNTNNQIDDGGGNTQNNNSIQDALNGSLNEWNNFNNDNGADSHSVEITTDITKTYTSTYEDSSQDNDLNGSFNDNSSAEIVAVQNLWAVNTNSEMDELVDLDGEDETDTAVGYNSGDNAVSGSAFAAYAGILNTAWNTGINANVQAATNIAAQGSVTFGE